MSKRLADNWHNFQEKVAGLFRQSPDYTVFIDQTLSGSRIRNVKVDVLVEFTTQRERHFPVRSRGFVFKIIVECKYWKTRIPQEKIFALKEIVEDTGAAMGILITEVGVQEGVKEYLARPGNLKAMTYKELASFILGMNVYSIERCAKCGAEAYLPMEADPERLHLLLCRDCHRERRESFYKKFPPTRPV
jgi:hypothetical protein